MNKILSAAFFAAMAMSPSLGLAWSTGTETSDFGGSTLSDGSTSLGGGGWSRLKAGSPPEEDFHSWQPGDTTDVPNPLFQPAAPGVNPLFGGH